MASKNLIDIALKLSKQLGANTNKFLGSRSNISFLGKGPKDDLLFQADLNVESLPAFPLNKLMPQIESSMGYLTGGKLNDIQATKLISNLEKIKEFNFPTQTANIIDLGTGTRNLTEEGLGALRATRKTDDDMRIIKDEVMTESSAPNEPQTIADRISEYIKKVREEKPTSWATDKPIDDFENYVLKGTNVAKAGPLDPVTGLTRTLARRILDKKGIEVGKSDPLDVFTEKFSGQVLTDVKNLAEGMLEAEKAGTKLKSMDELLEIEGLFDVKLIKDNPYFDTFKHGGLAKILEV